MTFFLSNAHGLESVFIVLKVIFVGQTLMEEYCIQVIVAIIFTYIQVLVQYFYNIEHPKS